MSQEHEPRLPRATIGPHIGGAIRQFLLYHSLLLFLLRYMAHERAYFYTAAEPQARGQPAVVLQRRILFDIIRFIGRPVEQLLTVHWPKSASQRAAPIHSLFRTASMACATRAFLALRISRPFLHT